MVQRGDPEAALRIVATVPASAQVSDVACNAIGHICLSASRYSDAVRWFDKSLAQRKDCPQVLAAKGLALYSLGRISQAIALYDQALAIRGHDPETVYNRGVALQDLGDLDAALASYDRALLQRPTYLMAMQKRCAVLEMRGHLAEALAGLEAILAIAPDCPDSWCNRANVLQKLGRCAEAVDCYDKALSRRQRFPAALANRAGALKELQRLAEALSDVTAALELEPSEPNALILRGNILQAIGRREEAERDFRSAVSVRPLIRTAAIKAAADFTALFVFSPLAGNTPYEDMISFSTYACNVLMLLPGAKYDVRFLRRHGDVVVNLVSDADIDSSSGRLLLAADLVDAIGKPVVNHPSKVLLTSREQISRTLRHIPDCCVPTTRRFSAAAIAEAAADRATFTFPSIVRVAGTHGGDRMERVDNDRELCDFVGAYRTADFYISDFVDYRSPDGFFRKYRFMYVGGEILPYHLAIGERWKVHHASTNMADHSWMQAEERRFLEEPQTVFGPRALEALRAIQTKIGLDYFGIDCALDREGRVIVFEANASMLVHLRNEQFPYKNDAVLRIKSEFASMLRSKVEADSNARHHSRPTS